MAATVVDPSTAVAAAQQNDELPRSRRSSQVLFGVSVLVLVVSLGLGAISVLKISAFINRSESTQILVEANSRVLPQTSREIQRVMIDLAEQPIDAEALEEHRAFVTQRVEEARSPRAQRAMITSKMSTEAEALGQRWVEEIEPRVEAVVASRQLDPSELTSLLADLAEMESQYNELAMRSEVARRNVGAKLLDEDRTAAANARNLTVILGVLVGTSSLFAAASALAMWRISSSLASAANRLSSVNHELRTVSRVAERTQNLVLILNPDGRIDWSNEAFRDRTGFSSSELQGMPFWELVESGANPDHLGVDEIEGRISAGEEFTCEVLTRCADGSNFLLSLEHRAVDEHSIVLNTIVIGADISEARQTEMLLIQAKESAEDAATAKSNFLATMSHEIRTPLNAVIGTAELLMGTQLTEEQREYTEVTRTSGRLLLSIVNDILTFSAFESSGADLIVGPHDLNLLAGSVVHMLRPLADSKRITLAYELRVDGDLRQDEPVWVVCDDGRLSQIITNLLSNALKFTDIGRVQLRAEVGAERTRILVSDTGIGIPEARVADLFKPFSQVDTSTTRRHGGTGLGLAICKQLAEALGGTIALQSEPGVGTVVTVDLPLLLVDDTSAKEPEIIRFGNDERRFDPRSAEIRNADDDAYRRLRVLVAEDDATNRRVAVRLLERLGVDAATVGDGAAAVDLVRSAAEEGVPYDLVLMDVHMPVLDGVDAAKRIVATYPPLGRPRIVALTANALPGDRERLLDQGMDDYLAKPVALVDLRGALDRALAAGPGDSAPSEPELPGRAAV